jgi:hypothetical protein
MTELKPCRHCSAPGRTETFQKNPTLAEDVTVRLCSNHRRFGGDCPDDQAYLTEAAWNTRPTDELAEALRTCAIQYLDMSAGTDLHPFVRVFQQGINDNLPVTKLMRWLGYIQGQLVAKGITTVEDERNWTRPLFRPIEFPQEKQDG